MNMDMTFLFLDMNGCAVTDVLLEDSIINGPTIGLEGMSAAMMKTTSYLVWLGKENSPIANAVTRSMQKQETVYLSNVHFLMEQNSCFVHFYSTPLFLKDKMEGVLVRLEKLDEQKCRINSLSKCIPSGDVESCMKMNKLHNGEYRKLTLLVIGIPNCYSRY